MRIFGLQKLTLLDYPGQIACTVFLGGCNMRCPFCHNGALARGDGGEVMSVCELLAFLDTRVGRLGGVCISGGEPTLYPDLPELIREIKSRGFAVKLDTNGTRPDMLRRLIDENLLDYVAMDIKNSPERYGETAGLGVQSSELASPARVAERSEKPSLLGKGDHGVVDEVYHQCDRASASGGPALPVDEVSVVRSIARPQNAESLLENVKQSAAILMEARVDFEFRTTLVCELHSENDLISIGKWLSGGEKYFLQTYRDEGDLLVGGFTSFTREETERLLATLREYIPNASVR